MHVYTVSTHMKSHIEGCELVNCCDVFQQNPLYL